MAVTPMRILLLGATGLLGQAMKRVALRRGHTLVAAARQNADLIVDVSDVSSLKSAIDSAAYDLVVNCVALVDLAACERSPEMAYTVNARPLAVLADACSAQNIRLLHVSTDHYYVAGGNVPHSEREPVTFLNEYARTKYAGEAFALSCPSALVLRTSIVGIRGWTNPTLAEWAIAAIENDAPATLYSDAYTSSIDTESFCEAALDMIDNDAVGLYNLAAGEVYSKEQFVRALASCMGCVPTKLTSGRLPTSGVVRAGSLGLDVSRAEALLRRPLPSLMAVVKSVLAQRQ
jgi:dTDP-4-dehydrorhamnose reductase